MRIGKTSILTYRDASVIHVAHKANRIYKYLCGKCLAPCKNELFVYCIGEAVQEKI